MNQFRSKILLSGVFCIIFFLPGYCQNLVNADTAVFTFQKQLFLQASVKQSRLKNGREYIPNPDYIKGTPYFESKTWAIGSIHYDGGLFENISMLYDMHKDEVVVLDFSLPNNLSLVRQKVKQFDIYNHVFVYVFPDALNNNIIEGFYDQLYAGKISILVKRRKNIVASSSNMDLDSKFVQSDTYFLNKEGVLYPIKSQSSILKLLKAKKSEIVQNLKRNDINFRENPEKAMIKIAAYYDQITN